MAIARSLVRGHSIVLADEPTGNLDTENGAAIIDILGRLAHEQNILVNAKAQRTLILQAFRMVRGEKI